MTIWFFEIEEAFMLVLVTLVACGTTVPASSQVILRVESPVQLTAKLLAQASDAGPDREEMESLEEDMAGARRRLGHGSETEVTPSLPASEAQDEPAKTAAPPAMDSRHAPPVGPTTPPSKYRAVYEGHGKIHYLVWGIVDWTIAGGLWASSLYLALWSLLYFGAADAVDRIPDDNLTEKQMRGIGLVFAGLSIGLGIGGGVVATNAGENIGIFRQMKREERQHRYSGSSSPGW